MTKVMTEILENGNLRVTIPWRFRNCANRRRIIIGDDPEELNRVDPITLAIARGRRWQAYIDDGRFARIGDLARAVGMDAGNVAFCLRLAMLAPDVIHRLSGTLEN